MTPLTHSRSQLELGGALHNFLAPQSSLIAVTYTTALPGSHNPPVIMESTTMSRRQPIRRLNALATHVSTPHSQCAAGKGPSSRLQLLQRSQFTKTQVLPYLSVPHSLTRSQATAAASAKPIHEPNFPAPAFQHFSTLFITFNTPMNLWKPANSTSNPTT